MDKRFQNFPLLLPDSAMAPTAALALYTQGHYPMGQQDFVAWMAPPERAVIPLDPPHVGRSLRKAWRKHAFEITTDHAFAAVLDACAGISGPARPGGWMTPGLRATALALHAAGHAHSVECWQDGQLVGGLYGLAHGGVFFGESMFHLVPDASKIAALHLIARLRAGGFQLLDTQMVTDHTARFGAAYIPRRVFEQRLHNALPLTARWDSAPTAIAAETAQILKTTGEEG